MKGDKQEFGGHAMKWMYVAIAVLLYLIFGG